MIVIDKENHKFLIISIAILYDTKLASWEDWEILRSSQETKESVEYETQ